MGLFSIEQEAEKILAQTYSDQMEFDKVIEPYLKRDFKSAVHFIRTIMRSQNAEIKTKIFKSKTATLFISNNHSKIHKISDIKYSVKEIFQDDAQVFLIDKYPWVDFCEHPVKDVAELIIKDYPDKNIIFYDVDHKWKIIINQVFETLDEIWEKKRQDLLDEPDYKIYKNVSDLYCPDWLKKKYKKENVFRIEEYSGWVPDEFQIELFKLELSKN